MALRYEASCGQMAPACAASALSSSIAARSALYFASYLAQASAGMFVTRPSLIAVSWEMGCDPLTIPLTVFLDTPSLVAASACVMPSSSSHSFRYAPGATA